MIDVSTRRFEASHGRAPRGYGHWGFFFDGETDAPVFFVGSYSEAKAEARKFARAHGRVSIEVAP